MSRRISVIGTSFHTAGLGRRERLALDADGVARLLEAIARERTVPEAVVLSTCNRTEIITASADARGEARLLGQLGEVCGGAIDESILYRHRGPAAVTHVLRVAAALDSQVVGEHEILGQLKEAYRLATEAGTAGFLLHRLMHRAFRVGKRVQSETALSQGRAGLPQVAAAAARQLCGDLAGRRALVIGAGKAARLAASALLREGATQLTIANRTAGRAAELAEALRRCHAGAAEVRAAGLDDVPSLAGEADVVIAAAGGGACVLSRANAAEALSKGRRPVVLIDLAVPHDIEPALGELPNVRLVTLDDLKGQADEALERRRSAVPAAEAIVRQEAEEFCRWLETLQVAPVIRRLQQRLAELQRAEIDRYCRKHGDADRARMERLARGMVRKALHGPITFLKRLAAEERPGEDLASLDLLRRMFDLDDEPPS